MRNHDKSTADETKDETKVEISDFFFFLEWTKNNIGIRWLNEIFKSEQQILQIPNCFSIQDPGNYGIYFFVVV